MMTRDWDLFSGEILIANPDSKNSLLKAREQRNFFGQRQDNKLIF
jgi:hypothetical protein